MFVVGLHCILLFKLKTAYEVRISDGSSDVCSSDLSVTRSTRRRSGRTPYASRSVWKPSLAPSDAVSSKAARRTGPMVRCQDRLSLSGSMEAMYDHGTIGRTISR